MTGGSAPYRKGAAFERETQKYLEGADWLVVRQPKSQSSFDLIAVKKTMKWLVQCKLNGKIPKKEKEALLEVCDTHHCSAVLAWKEGKEIKLKYLSDGKEIPL